MPNPENLKPFKKGDDPRRNTKGAGVSLKTKLKEALDRIHEGTGTRYDELFVQATMKDGIKVDGQSRRLIWQYIEGMPLQKTENNNTTKLILDEENKKTIKKTISEIIN